ncbi:YbaY family lipoprotein [Sandaracinobacter sp. RS1-74]|uniref:YbaY family lipoprotein n=1 Tax=Sandaracinobacteroides sayramensis TaxID=2913411 RepID=UPI001EDBC6DF|nr:YbaY family lipoprotein [Sandaracinobacteroides sayramensis]MCG2842241.1 YbaY family lipoprotein [Sandaracinobacteroides sayramensis]
MKPVIFAVLLAATAACAGSPPVEAQPAPQTPAVAEPAQTAPAFVPPEASPGGQKPVLPLRDAQNFICGDGQLVSIEHDQPAGILRAIRGGEVFTLQEQVGYTPARFVTGSDSVEIDGDKAKLRRGKNVAEQSCHRLPAVPEAGAVWGTLVKLDRMALPAGTRAKVLLVDAARADAPAVELGSFQIETTGNQVPLHYLVHYDVARTQHPASPRLQARIETAKGELMYITDTANPIPNDGSAAPSPIELKLVRTGGK